MECLSACETKIGYLTKMGHRDFLSDASPLKSPLLRAMHIKCLSVLRQNGISVFVS